MNKLFRGRVARPALVFLLIAAFGLAAAGCGTKTVTSTGANGQVTTQTVANVHFSNAKFLLHAGLAFGAIHRYIYKPLRNGALRSGASGRVKTLAKGAIAALFAVHELKIAHEDALSSNQLRPLANRISGLGAKLSALIAGLRNGTASPGSIAGAASATDALGSASQAAGFGIKDIVKSL